MKNLFVFSAPNDLSNIPLKYCSRALNHTVHTVPKIMYESRPAIPELQDEIKACCVLVTDHQKEDT
jgi:hypothetical protein